MVKNKIIIIMVIFLVICSVLIGLLFLMNAKSPLKINFVKGDGFMEEFKITDIRSTITNNIFENGCVRDEQCAAEIAAAIFKSVYGENFDYGLPLVLNFNDSKQEWLIRTQLPKNMDGGSKYIIIKKSNAEVVAIWAEK